LPGLGPYFTGAHLYSGIPRSQQIIRTSKSVNFIRTAQKIAAAENIVVQNFGCDGMPANLTRRMHRSFRMVLEAGGNEYDAALGFVLGTTLEQLEQVRQGLVLPDLKFDRVCNIVRIAENLLQETLLLRAARDTGSVLAEIRLLADRMPPR
jgi:hypothetical protein